MARVKSVYKAIENLEINENYAMCITHLSEIREHANSQFDVICDSFDFGYLQGMKAARAEMRRGGMA